MNHDTAMILSTLRGQAWERVKGELGAVAKTFHSEGGSNAEEFEQFKEFSDRALSFINDIEGEGLC
jgi:hypothetical protein